MLSKFFDVKLKVTSNINLIELCISWNLGPYKSFNFIFNLIIKPETWVLNLKASCYLF